MLRKVVPLRISSLGLMVRINVIVLLFAARAGAQCGTPAWTFNDPTPGIYQDFGGSVAISGNCVLVGATGDTYGMGGGRAYLFDAATASQIRAFDNPTPASNDRFGSSVAISGNYVLVGAYTNDAGASQAGSTYLLDAATGSLLWTFNNPTPEDYEAFGFSVAISGNNIVVGAPHDNGGAADAGAVYLYDAGTGSLLLMIEDPTPVSYELFGYSVAIQGNNVLVGARYDYTGGLGAGAAYLYDAATGALLRTFNNPSPANNDYFGESVAISANRVLIGASGDNAGAGNAGAAHLFDGASGALLRTFNNPTPASNDYFGASVAISGNNVLVGAFSDDTGEVNAGSAYLFDAATGSLRQTFNNPSPELNDRFGDAVAISGDGVLVGVRSDNPAGADGAGTAYLYTCPRPNAAGDWVAYE